MARMEKEEQSERSATRGVAEVRKESSGTMERRVVRLLMFGEGGLEKKAHMEKGKRCGIMKSHKIRIILYFYFCYTLDKNLY